MDEHKPTGYPSIDRLPSHKMVRELPNNAKKVVSINGIDLYSINTFQNIMSWNQKNLDVPAFDYFGTTITYGELPRYVEEQAKGFDSIGIDVGTIVTVSLPVTIECYLSLFALVNLGAISNNVNFLFLRNNLAKYTTDKKSDTLIIPDIYLPLIADQLKNTKLKNVILTSLSDYLPEEKKALFTDLSKFPQKVREFLEDSEKMKKAAADIADSKEIRFIKMSELIQMGRESIKNVSYPPVNLYRDSIYSYTSGTTGEPKCIVFTEQSPNAIIEMHNGLNLRDYVGDRSLVVIPPSHATGMFYAAYLQLAKGKTLVLQPIYDKKTFAEDLRDFRINHTLSAASFYLEAVAQDIIKAGELKALTRPCSGGEPITKSNVFLINEWLKRAGCPEKIAIGGGSGEVGSSALTSYELNPDTKTNETGYPIPGVYIKIVDPETGVKVRKGERGIIHVSSAASCDRYLDNPEATSDLFYIDKNGVRWANLGDIAVENYDGSISMLGRSSDSYIDEDGQRKYLFDIEYALSLDDPVLEWEITAFQTDSDKTDVVAQVVLKKEYVGKEESVAKNICEKYHLDGIKFYDSFEVSEVTGKRDYQLLKHDYTGYYKIDCSGNFHMIDYQAFEKMTEESE